MRTQSFRPLTAAVLLGLTAACASDPTGVQDPDAELVAAFESLAAEANRRGDADAGASLTGGSLALRMGVRPGVIMVVVDGKAIRHRALVAGVTRMIGGETRMIRSLFAWTGDRAPRSLLEVTLADDSGDFGDPQGAGRAWGVYAALGSGVRWVATEGTATIVVAETDGPCGRSLGEHPNLTCVKARFSVAVDGTFHQMGSSTDAPTNTRIQVSAEAGAVPGVVVSPGGN